MNKCIIVGNLTRDTELRQAPSGVLIATNSIATNRYFRKSDNTKGKETCFVDIVIFGNAARIMEQYTRKGVKIVVEGRLNISTWRDK